MNAQFAKWKDNSINQHDADFVIENLIFHSDEICVCLVCRHYNLSEELIEQIYLVTAGLYKGAVYQYNKKQIDTITKFRWLYEDDKSASIALDGIIQFKLYGHAYNDDILPKSGKDIFEAMFDMPNTVLLNYKNILDGKDEYEKVDWKAIKECQAVSKKFKKRFHNKFNTAVASNVSDYFIPKGKYNTHIVK